MLRDRGAAEDVVQQAFLELTEAVAEFEGQGSSLRAWMYRCVRYRCLDEIRRRRRHPESPVENPAENETVDFEDPVDEMLDPELETALSQLTEQQRSVLFLRHVVGMSGAETARVLGTNRAAVYAMAARAEASLRKTLSPVESEGSVASEPEREGQREADTSTAWRYPAL